MEMSAGALRGSRRGSALGVGLKIVTRAQNAGMLRSSESSRRVSSPVLVSQRLLISPPRAAGDAAKGDGVRVT